MGISKIVVGYRICIHSHVMCIRVDAAAEGVVYEVIAEAKEHPEQVQPGVRKDPAQGPFALALSSSPKASPVHILLI